jgi:thymidylate kinase
MDSVQTGGRNVKDSHLELISAIDVEPSPPTVANRQLGDVFSELEQAGVEYCVLRGIDELTSESVWQEVDLLVAPEDMDLFVYTVRRNGFASWPSWGHEPHRFFMTYDAQSGSWLKLDVVNELRYGKPFRCIPVDIAASCLCDRQRWGPTWVTTVDDEFLTTTLHCVLDKGGFRDEHRRRLRMLWKSLNSNVRLRLRFERKVTSLLGKDGFAGFAYAMESDDWQSLLLMRGRWTRRFFRRAPFSTTWSRARSAVLRRIRRILFLSRCRGTSTVLLAPDGGGKSTLSAALANDPFLRAQVVYMGGNLQAAGLRLPTTLWLARQMKRRRGGSGFVRMNRWVWRSLLRPASSFNHLVEDWLRFKVGQFHKLAGRFVVYDRYYYDTYLSPRTNSLRVRLRRWVLQRMSGMPDRVLLLDAPGEVLYARKQEHSPEVLEAQRQILLELSNRIPNVTVVDTTRGAEAARRRAVWLMWNDYAMREGPPSQSSGAPVLHAPALRELG